MAETLQFDLVSPERRHSSIKATEVQIPGTEGDLTAMADHAPLLTTLRPGVLRVVHAGGIDEYIVSGGFAEINGASVSVLAEQAMPKGKFTQGHFDEMLAQARKAHAAAQETFKNEPGPVDDAAKLLADLVAVGGHIGLTAGHTGPLPG